MSRHSAEADDTPWPAVGLRTSQNVTGWYQASASDIQDRGLLSRGFESTLVHALVLVTALTWAFFVTRWRWETFRRPLGRPKGDHWSP